MKKILIVLLFVMLSFAYPASAVSWSDVDITTILPDLIASGGNKIMESIGDQMYGMAGINNTSQAQSAISDYILSSPHASVQYVYLSVYTICQLIGSSDQSHILAIWIRVWVI